MRRWKVWRVLAVCTGYLLVAALATLWFNISRVHAVAEAYKRANGVAPSDKYLVGTGYATWQLLPIVGPPVVFFVLWLSRRRRKRRHWRRPV